MTEENSSPTATPIRNRAVSGFKVFDIGLVVSYPFAVWFGLAILDYPPSLLGFTLVWIMVFLVVHYFPNVVRAIRFDEIRLIGIFRKGARAVRYEEVVRLVWAKDFSGGGVVLWLRNGDIVRLGGLDSKLLQRTVDVVKRSRPDLSPEQVHHGLMASWGLLADAEHRGENWRMTWLESFDYDHTFWGARPKGVIEKHEVQNSDPLK